MAMGIGAFLDGFVGGVNQSRKWKKEDKLDKQAEEDRRLALEDRTYGRLRDQKQDLRADRADAMAIDDHRYSRELTEEERGRKRYDFARKRAADSREEDIRDATADAFKQAQAGYQGLQTEADKPVEPEKGGTPGYTSKDGERTSPLGITGTRLPSRAPVDPKVARVRAGQSFADYFAREAGPKIAEAKMKQGDIEGAQTFIAWSQDAKVKEGITEYGKALHAAHAGDDAAFADHMVNLYNNEDYLGDGIEAVRSGTHLKMDKDGNVTGAQVTFRDKATGKTRVQDFDSMQDLYAAALTAMSPQQVFEQAMGQIGAQAKSAEEDAKLGRDMQLEAWKAMVQAGGKADEQSKKQFTDLYKAMADNNLDFPKLPPEAQAQAVAKLMDEQDSALAGRGRGITGAVQAPWIGSGGAQPAQAAPMVWRGQ